MLFKKLPVFLGEALYSVGVEAITNHEIQSFKFQSKLNAVKSLASQYYTSFSGSSVISHNDLEACTILVCTTPLSDVHSYNIVFIVGSEHDKQPSLSLPIVIFEPTTTLCTHLSNVLYMFIKFVAM